MTKIEWTDATWNPIVGCSIVSPGCTNCYAMKMAARIEAMGSGPHYSGLTKRVKGNAVWTGKLALAPDHILLEPLKRKKPTMYFVNSMGDLFHEDCPDEWIDRVFAIMALCPQHTFQVLTKRAKRMREYLSQRNNAINGQIWAILGTGLGSKIDHGGKWQLTLPAPNVWLGVSAERQQEADERIPDLLATPAAVRFISVEPLLGPIKLWAFDEEDQALRGVGIVKSGGRTPSTPHNPAEGYDDSHPGIDWVIVGGESGPDARPMHPDWARAIRDQCQPAGVAFFFKQWGAWAPEFPHPVSHDAGALTAMTTIASTERSRVGERSYLAGSGLDQPSTPLRRVNKKAAGRLLDGREWNEMPNLSAVTA